jgi:serine/threonine protein kinase
MCSVLVHLPFSFLFGSQRGKNSRQQYVFVCVGVIVWELLTGKEPFAGLSMDNVRAIKARNDFVFPIGQINRSIPYLIELMHACLQNDPAHRPTTKQIVDTFSNLPCLPIIPSEKNDTAEKIDTESFKRTPQVVSLDLTATPPKVVRVFFV